MPVAFLVTLVAVGAARLLMDGVSASPITISAALAIAAAAAWIGSRRLHAAAIRDGAAGLRSGAIRSRAGVGRYVLELLNVAFGLALAAALILLGAIGAP